MPVIRPFALADILLVQRLQGCNTPLAIEHTLTHPHAPLWLALTAPWPWAGVGVATYVIHERNATGRLAGFVQLRKRAARPEADLLHLAPSLDDSSNGNASLVWHRLLLHCCQEAAHHGLERLFVSTPDDGPEEAILAETGFRPYTRETIFRVDAVPKGEPLQAGFRAQRPEDSWALQRLYSRCSPRLVQQAEGALTQEAGSPPMSWWEPARWRGAVLAPAGEVRGAVQVHSGRAGHWLRVWGASALTARELRELVGQGLRLLAITRRTSKAPVYATVRDYEIGLSGALTGYGFAPYARRARFVRHTLARCNERAPAKLRALESHKKIPIRTQVEMVSTPAESLPQPLEPPADDRFYHRQTG